MMIVYWDVLESMVMAWHTWSWHKFYGTKVDTTLVSTRIELIFFLLAGTVLCFAFSLRIILITL